MNRFSFRENTFRSNDTRENEVAFTANIEMLGSLFNRATTHKFGVKARIRSKTAEEERWRDRRAG